MPKSTRRWTRTALVALAGLVLAGCAEDAPMDSLDPKGPNARAIDDLIGPVFIVAGIILVLVTGATLYMAYRYRVGRHPEDDWPDQVEGNTRVEILWTLIPTVILSVIAVFTLATLLDLNTSDANAIEVDVNGETVEWEPTVIVVGQQWWWEYRYYFDDIDVSEYDLANDLPEADIVTATQMVIPAGEEIEIYTTSRDVIHSYWIPPLNGKRDAVPGRFSPWKLEADEPGVYFGTCTEFCGLSHSRMQMQVVAVDADDFQAWIDEQMSPYGELTGDEATWLEATQAGADDAGDPPSSVARGIATFRAKCSSCHLVDGVNDDIYEGATVVPGHAPNLTHFASRTRYAGGILELYDAEGNLNANDLEQWLRNPVSVKDMAPDEGRGMPNLGLTEDEIDDLVAFLATTGSPPNASLTIPESVIE